MKKSINLMWFGKVGVAAAFCVGSISGFAQDSEIKSAERLIEQDKKKQAIDVLQKATATYPASAQLYYHLGHAQLLAGDQAGAKSSFDKGVATNAKEPLNYVGQGHILILEKKGAQAKPLFDKALGFGKKNVATLQAIAEAEMLDKTYSKDALALLNRAKEINPADAKTFLLLGDYYLTENNGGSTASAYEDAAAQNPASAVPWFKHAKLFMRSKNIAIVEEDLLKAVKIDPDFALAHKDLGELYYQKKDGPNAAKHYKIYLDLTDSPDKDDRFRYAFFLFMAKDYSKANDEFKALSMKPDVSSTTLKFYAQSLLKEGKLAESQKVFEQYLSNPQTKPDDDDFNNYAELLQQQGKDSLAAIAFQTSLNLNSNQPKNHQILIDYYFKAKKYSKCESACRAAIKTRKQPFFNDYFNLGRSLYLEKKYPPADSAFAKTIELQPKITLGYTWAARSKSQQDTLLTEGLAKPFYEKVIEIGEADKEKNKKDLTAAYQYMGSYHMIKQENQIAKGYWEKVLELTPDDPNAKEALKLINTPTQAPPKKKKS
jgi:tetratricopeptide (TPR) repeat protein